jgi:hypothetical protein
MPTARQSQTANPLNLIRLVPAEGAGMSHAKTVVHLVCAAPARA